MPRANNNASRTAATTALMAEAGASFIKTSMFPSAGPFSGAVSFVEYWTIQHNYKRCEQVTRLLRRWLIFYGTKLPTNQTNS